MFLLTKIIWPLGKRFRTRMAGSRTKKTRNAPKIIINLPTPRICFVVDSQMNTEALIKYHVIFVLQSGYLLNENINQGKSITCSTPTRYLLSVHSLDPTISLVPSSTKYHKKLPNLFYCQLSKRSRMRMVILLPLFWTYFFPVLWDRGAKEWGSWEGVFEALALSDWKSIEFMAKDYSH